MQALEPCGKVSRAATDHMKRQHDGGVELVYLESQGYETFSVKDGLLWGIAVC